MKRENFVNVVEDSLDSNGMQQQNPPHCESGSLIASNRHLNVKQPVACQTVAAQYILTISSISN